jgi:hypothetical protein
MNTIRTWVADVMAAASRLLDRGAGRVRPLGGGGPAKPVK